MSSNDPEPPSKGLQRREDERDGNGNGAGQREDCESRGGRYIMLLSVHGLLRGFEMELGRDADTGGQITYVVELARALAKHPDVDQVDLVTRLVEDAGVDRSYARRFEELSPGARIVRIACGPARYLRKELLWPHLDEFIDNLVVYIRDQGRAPDLVHGHYADAGSIAAHLAGLFDVPMVFTGHSLGRVKRERLLEKGSKPESIERRYHISRRIEAEEVALDNASFVVASTHQEVEQQYAMYDNYQPRRMLVIPPGVDLSRFSPPQGRPTGQSKIEADVARFLRDPRKPMVLAICRPDPRKNIPGLVRAFGENEALRHAANLVIVAGNRDDLSKAEKGVRRVLTECMSLIDYYDLYGSAAYPKHHTTEDVPELYRMAARTKGVFVNCALTEPFGLTLLEAAASGVPIVATQDGGPSDIVSACKNGVLVDPLDKKAIGDALLVAVTRAKQWRQWSSSGLRGVHRHFSWTAHVGKYMRAANVGISQSQRQEVPFSVKKRLVAPDRLIVADLDETLTGDEQALRALLATLKQSRNKVAFGVATGRSAAQAEKILRKWRISAPTLLITSVGTSIHYGKHLTQDLGWQRRINYRWRPEGIREALNGVPGVTLQGPESQSRFKVSFFVDPEKSPGIDEIRSLLRRNRVQANVIFSRGMYLDVVPVRASKASALRYFLMKWNIQPQRCLVAGESESDRDMLLGNVAGVVVAGHEQELEALRDQARVYFATKSHAWGILEAIDHYRFLESVAEAGVGDLVHA